MMPGMGRGVNPRQMKQAMKRMGISQEEMQGVEEVIIRTADKEYVIKGATVSCIVMQGQKTYQVVGEAEEHLRQAVEQGEADIPDQDIELVMSQTGASKEKAVQALKDCEGQPAEAILKIMSG
ncbi:MAG TPA: nascent polypeptide-associated complex protein [Methanomassiliicoccales archaeon]|nr:nascent polypeptide-associated complex protein [Methanomassiliicoccales archaeon]